ncbi:MAG: FAD-dependent oxidoreductase [Pseudomonadota bacterium]
MREFEHVASMGRRQGLTLDMCSPTDLQAHFPFMETHDLAGGLWDPLDGYIDPAQMTQALAKAARETGGIIQRNCPATGVRRDGGEWVIETPKGEIRAEYVVNAAGYYAGRVADWFKPFGGRDVPMAVMSHQYFLTEEIPEIAAWSAENGRKLPLLRDVDSSYYLRQDKNGLNLGPYERNCKAHWLTDSDPMPEDFSFQLYPDDLDRLEWYIEDAMARVPVLGTAGVGRVINGPIPYAPDGLPLLGPMPGVANAFEAHAFTFGIVQGGGAGKIMAEWITEGRTEWDTWSLDPRRFTDHADHDYSVARALETYGHEYAMHFPHQTWPAGRDKKRSTLHEALQGQGAQMGAYGGWERANWFAAPGDDVSAEAAETWDRAGPWAARVRGECEAVRDGCGAISLAGFSRYHVSGAGAAETLDRLIAGALPKVGRLTLGYFVDAKGKLLTEMSVLRLDEDAFLLLTAAPALWHDLEILTHAAPNLDIKDVTRETEALLVTGPKARDVLSDLTDGDLTRPWLSHQEAQVAGHPARLVRVSFAGELGWEVHAAPDAMPEIYAAVIAAGAKPFGMFALNALRLEKGYRAWRSDLSTNYSPLECGLDRFVRLDKGDFQGRAALLTERQQGPARRAAMLTLAEGPRDPLPMAPVWQNGTCVGEVTSAAYGYRVGAPIALAMVEAGAATPGTALEVECFGERLAATVAPEGALWDPENERIRA